MPEEEKSQNDLNAEEVNHDAGPEVSEPAELPRIPINNPDVPENAMQEQIPSPTVDHASKPVIIRRLIMLLLAIIVIAGIGVAAWKLIPSKKDSSPTSGSNQNQSEQAQPQNNSTPADNSLSETYSSDSLRVQFKYPGSWKVSEDNNGIIVKSSNIDFTLNDGSQASGYFKIYIKQGANENDGQYLGKGYAIASSEKISYSEPLTGQRKDTYLTNFGIDMPDNFAYFIVQGNFKLKKGDTLGPKFASEPDSYLIGGGFATDDQKDGLATQILPIDAFSQNNTYKTAVEIVKSLQLK